MTINSLYPHKLERTISLPHTWHYLAHTLFSYCPEPANLIVTRLYETTVGRSIKMSRQNQTYTNFIEHEAWNTFILTIRKGYLCMLLISRAPLIVFE